MASLAPGIFMAKWSLAVLAGAINADYIVAGKWSGYWWSHVDG